MSSVPGGMHGAAQKSIDTYQNRITSQILSKNFGNMMNEELMHAKIFDEIGEKLKADDSIQFEITIDMDQLKGFIV